MGLLAACAGHKPPPPSSDIDEAGFRDDLRILAADDFEGRRPGTPGEDKTVAFLTAQFRRLGLKPGNGDSYVQPVPLVETIADHAALSIVDRSAAKPLLYAEDMVIWTPWEAAEASLQRSELVFVGYGIVAPEFDWNDYAGTDVHGKTVVVLVGDPGYGSRDPRLFKGGAATEYGLAAYKFAEAARQGAAGVLLIHDPGATGYAWNVVLSDATGPQLRAVTADGSAPQPAVEGWLAGAAARGLWSQAGLDFGISTAAASRPGFKPIALGLTVEASVHNSWRRFTSANVIALLPGAGHKHEYVIYTAHWDHLGRQPPESGGAVYNGAVEDASGVAGLLMLAQSFVRTQPGADRSIVFIAFTGEEAGLLGSAHYVAAPLFPLRQTVAALNLEQLHIGGPTRDVVVFGFGNSELDEYVRDAALLQGREIHPDPVPEQGLYYRSDQLSFAAAGVPALFAKAGLDDAARGPAWGRARLDDYLTQRYHQPGDRYSADWDVRGTLEDLRLYFAVGNRLARSRRFPRWYPNSEFRGSRHRDQGVPAE